jgi:SRSO17 transposase
MVARERRREQAQLNRSYAGARRALKGLWSLSPAPSPHRPTPAELQRRNA